MVGDPIPGIAVHRAGDLVKVGDPVHCPACGNFAVPTNGWKVLDDWKAKGQARWVCHDAACAVLVFAAPA